MVGKKFVSILGLQLKLGVDAKGRAIGGSTRGWSPLEKALSALANSKSSEGVNPRVSGPSNWIWSRVTRVKENGAHVSLVRQQTAEPSEWRTGSGDDPLWERTGTSWAGVSSGHIN